MNGHDDLYCYRCGGHSYAVVTFRDGRQLCQECIRDEAKAEAAQYIPQPED